MANEDCAQNQPKCMGKGSCFLQYVLSGDAKGVLELYIGPDPHPRGSSCGASRGVGSALSSPKGVPCGLTHQAWWASGPLSGQ